MADIDRFDRQLAAAIHGFADGARTEVDAVAVATRAARGHRSGATSWLGRTVPVPIVLLLVALLLLTLASLAAGGWRLLPGFLFQATLPSASVPASAESTAGPTPNPFGSVQVSGTETLSLETASYLYLNPVQLSPGGSTGPGDLSGLSGGVESVVTTTNDARANGSGTFEFTVSLVGTVGTWTGTYGLLTPDGAWQGTCNGSTWNSGQGAVGSCWLTGSGGFTGLTYFRSFSWVPGDAGVEGIIYPGPPPGP